MSTSKKTEYLTGRGAAKYLKMSPGTFYKTLSKYDFEGDAVIGKRMFYSKTLLNKIKLWLLERP